ncbi:MAG TPA: hypothetical protein VGF01_01875 [Terracidiphilus sp.]
MKSVDRDYVGNGSMEQNWLFAYAWMIFGTICFLDGIWNEVHLHGWSYRIFLKVAAVLLMFISPLMRSLQFRKYIRSALKEDLVNERVATNCEYFMGQQLFAAFTFFAMILLVTHGLFN